MEELFDYAPILIKADRLIKELDHGCLNKKYDGLEEKCTELLVQARMLRAWVNHMKDRS
jgi:hypothetical protein